MTARSAAEIRADLADCDRDGLPWPSAARRLLADIEPLLVEAESLRIQVTAVEALLPATAAEVPIFPSQLRVALGASRGEYLLLRWADIKVNSAVAPEQSQ